MSQLKGGVMSNQVSDKNLLEKDVDAAFGESIPPSLR
eukprot:CAMPEP_0185599542 /NCGR_PEP_ID=MMETSP0434-20130131/82783_1 /TAXON_ID=626734 ORGANISM="Favella taraikaensis, Strain Fe Narragansett Bay" /NCGR_SAMPLE_ID=MMETSP0434 /ASSEMBLY_ACC=CAM_ASM_000379 /LENGTH=36 /DNA_ID= /DNA_START= /DNA_END= /DNA_ORIENTATION=